MIHSRVPQLFSAALNRFQVIVNFHYPPFRSLFAFVSLFSTLSLAIIVANHCRSHLQWCQSAISRHCWCRNSFSPTQPPASPISRLYIEIRKFCTTKPLSKPFFTLHPSTGNLLAFQTVAFLHSTIILDIK